jgi:phosphotransferase system  glucose/maltose/N-acetylglucosamine-specific IIC component
VGIAAYLLFFVAGLGFGYAASGKWKWLPMLFPLALAIGAAVQEGVDAALVLRLVVALVLTAAGVILGAMLDARGERGERGEGGEQARYA